MPQGMPELPEMFKRQNDPRSQQTLEIGQAGLPGMMPGQAYPSWDRPLQETPEAPEFAIANAMTGGAAFAPALLKGLFMNAVISNAANKLMPGPDIDDPRQRGKGFDEGTLTERMSRRGYQIPERMGQSRFKSGGEGFKDYGSEATLPISAVPGWYTPEHFRQAEAYSPYRVKGTEKFRYPFSSANQPGATGEMYDITELAHPSLLRTSSAPILPPDDPLDLSKQFGYSMHERNPLDLIWHGLGTDVGTAGKAVPNLQAIRSSGGMNMGWFNRTPHGDFGPLFIGADPKDLPPTRIEPRSLRVDPRAQIVPNWDEGRGWGEETVGGRPVPDVSIHPSKLAVIDQEGNLLGSVADFRPGLEHGEERRMEPRRFIEPSQRPIGEYGEIRTPEHALRAKEDLLAQLKNLPKGKEAENYSPYMAQDIRTMLKDINEALRSEKKPVANWATQHLPDLRKLFEEAE